MWDPAYLYLRRVEKAGSTLRLTLDASMNWLSFPACLANRVSSPETVRRRNPHKEGQYLKMMGIFYHVV
jgi:hypothetical protein